MFNYFYNAKKTLKNWKRKMLDKLYETLLEAYCLLKFDAKATETRDMFGFDFNLCTATKHSIGYC